MRRAFYFDQEKCMGCNTCAVACKDWNQVNPGAVRWRTQITHEQTSAPYFFPLSMACNHCETPACQAACPASAISKNEDGLVLVDRDKCQEFKSCITACPFAIPQIAGDQQEPNRQAYWISSHPMQKCDMCLSRLQNGQKPECVASCVAHALDAGDFDTLKAMHPTAVQMNKTDFHYAYANDNTTTGPSFLINKRSSLAITKAIPKP